MAESLHREIKCSGASTSSGGCGSVFYPPELNFHLPELGDVHPPFQKWDGLPVDVLLLTVKDPEFLSCYYFLSQGQDVSKSMIDGLGMVYIGKVGDDHAKKVKLALIKCNEAAGGPGGSQSVIRDAVPLLSPKAVICAGLCGGLNKVKSKLGDVVISFKLSTYAHKKVSSGNQIQQRGTITNVSKNMMSLIKYAADGWKPPLKVPKALKVKVHSDGEMLSGPVLVNDKDLRAELISTYKTAIAIEMEGEGVYTAAQALGIEWVVIKGICDFADGTKSSTEGWQPFSSAMAASVIFKMLKEPDVLKGWSHYGSVQNQKWRTYSLLVHALLIFVSLATGYQLFSQVFTEVPASQLTLNTSPQEKPLQELLQSLTGGSTGQIIYKGRTIAYKSKGRVHSLDELWVFDAEAWDIESRITAHANHFKESGDAIREAINKLIEKLKEKGKIQD